MQRNNSNSGFVNPKLLVGTMSVSFLIGFVAFKVLTSPDFSRPTVWTHSGLGKWEISPGKQSVEKPGSGQGSSIVADTPEKGSPFESADKDLPQTGVETSPTTVDDTKGSSKQLEDEEDRETGSSGTTGAAESRSQDADKPTIEPEMKSKPVELRPTKPSSIVVVKPPANRNQAKQQVPEVFRSAEMEEGAPMVDQAGTSLEPTTTNQHRQESSVELQAKETRVLPPEPVANRPIVRSRVESIYKPQQVMNQQGGQMQATADAGRVEPSQAVKPTNKNLRILGSEHFPRTALPSGYSVKPLGQ